MVRLGSMVMASVVLAGMLTLKAEARDATKPQAQPATPGYVIPNPYLPHQRPGAAAPVDRAADAYATGFAIGLGTALINKQREDEMKRQQLQQQTGGRR